MDQISMAAFRLVLLGLLAFLSTTVLAQQDERSPSDYMNAIEGPQQEDDSSGPNSLGGLTIAELMDRFNVPGVSLAVINDFEVHWAKGYGVADVETGAPVDTATLFQAASISKPVAAMAVLRAVQDSIFGLDDDINDILTSWKLDGGNFTVDQPVTPRALTSHTSGLGDGFGFPGYDPSDPLPTVIQILDGDDLSNVGPVFMERPPFSFMEYSGGGVMVMQQALTDARQGGDDGQLSFADILNETVLYPIGMVNSTFEQPLSPEWDANAARAHNGDGLSQGPKWRVYPEQAAAGLWTTATDLARFAIEVQKSALGRSNRVLSRTMVQEMLSPVGVGSYAVGFGVDRVGEGWYFSHGGGNWGFQCYLIAHKFKGHGAVIMTNSDQGGAVMTELLRRIMNEYEWDAVAEPVHRGYDPPVERVEIEVAREILQTYVGRYEVPDLGLTIITLEGDGLYVFVQGEGKFRLYPETQTRFFLREDDVLVTFVSEGGEVTGIIVSLGPENVPGEKLASGDGEQPSAPTTGQESSSSPPNEVASEEDDQTSSADDWNRICFFLNVGLGQLALVIALL